jgi:hypothetical protein
VKYEKLWMKYEGGRLSKNEVLMMNYEIKILKEGRGEI